MRWNLILIVFLSLFLGACASKRQASSGKHSGNRPSAKAPDRPEQSGNRQEPSANKPARPANPSRSLDTEEYIRIYSSLAIEEMERSGVPASITLAQGILESGNGNSRLARQANNHFGIKCTSAWKGRKTYKDDDRRNECFRAYPSAKDSYRDHSEFLKRERYRFLFDLNPSDYKGWARGLKKAGYATNPRYPQLLISLIERYELYYYDRPRGKKPEKVLATQRESAPARPVATRETGKIKTATAGASTTAGTSAGGTVLGRTQPGTATEGSAIGTATGGTATTPGSAAGRPETTVTSHYYYTVKQGDTLFAISKRFDITVEELKDWNSLASNAISTGQQLRVSR